jgi:hypothetical protein
MPTLGLTYHADSDRNRALARIIMHLSMKQVTPDMTVLMMQPSCKFADPTLAELLPQEAVVGCTAACWATATKTVT